ISTALVDMYSKCGCMGEARQVFDSIHRRDVVSWNAIITGYAHGGASESALELYQLMQQDGFVPNGRTFVATLSACASLAAKEDRKQVVARGVSIHSQVAKTGYEEDKLNAFVRNSLVDMLAKCGSMLEARAVFEQTSHHDVVLWNSIIHGYAQSGDGEQALEMFSRMLDQGIRPDGVTFLSVLSACNHTGLVDQARKYFHALLEDYREYATIQHYSCMVDLLGRANHLEEALAVVKSMPMEPDSTIWTSILASSRKWENVEAGRAAFERIQEKDGAAFVLLANSYA
ncbi:hypothetical protein SELMODRAFT_34785, partial [Selaginella moellendorffii]